MRKLNIGARFDQWDGSQATTIDPDEVLHQMADDLMDYGNIRWAMRNLFSRGMKIPEGGYRQGLREMMKNLRDRKRQRLDQFDMSGIMKDIEKQLNEVLDLERGTIDEWQEKGRENDARNPEDFDVTDDVLKDLANDHEQQLNEMPEDTAGKMKALEKYEFLNPDAQKKYLELLNQLRDAVTNTMFKDLSNAIDNLSDGDIQRLKEMVKALNDMLVRKISGEEDPGFDQFMDEFGDMFGENPPESLDDLLQQMSNQMAAAQSMMASMSPDQRAQLQSLLGDRFGDPELESELSLLAKELDYLNPRGRGYRFTGDEDLDLEAAMKLMDEMHQLDDLIGQLQSADRAGNLDTIDKDLLRELLGEEAADSVDDMKKLMDALEEAGYIRNEGNDRWELTPRGSRLIGYKALGEIYARLKRQQLGNHAIPEEGQFGERLDQSKEYEFGDPMHLHLPRTIRNAIDREGPHTPVRLKTEDFEVYRSELITSTATAMLVDLSWSMAIRGSFQAAKKVALALHHLITAQYPKDSFYIIGFAAYAKELKPKDLPFLHWDEYVLGTNMQHALLLAERMLAKHDAGSKQIIMISDGEPTAHLENGSAQFAYPPTRETLQATYRAVKRCTQKGIAINTFMLDSSYFLREFMDEIARINGGRVFYTTPDRLGEYILVDYMRNKRTRIARAG